MEASIPVTVRERPYKGWDAWFLQRGPLELALVPQVGGRIMGMVWQGHDLFFTQPEREGQLLDLSGVLDVRAKKREMGFPLWGGDKTWLAPQNRWTEGVPFLDLDSGPYDFSVERGGPDIALVHMASRACRESGAQITRTIRIASDAREWRVIHRLHNTSAEKIEWGVWDVSMMLRPGQIYLPRSVSSLYPQGVKTYAEEGESVQTREEVVGELGGLAVIHCRQPRAFKFGVDAQEGWMVGIVDVAGLGLIGYRKEVEIDVDRPYAHGCTSEVFNSDSYSYFEMEIHGPLVSLNPGESFEVEEKQALFEVAQWPRDEKEVRRYLELSRSGSNSVSRHSETGSRQRELLSGFRRSEPAWGRVIF